MTWTPPTVEEFKIRFPEFVSVADPTAQAVLDEAVGEVGESWLERDRTPGVLHLTAHLLAVSGPGASGAGGGGAAVTGAIKRRKVGDVETEFAGVGGGTSTGGALDTYRTTAYGVRFLSLMRRNFPAVAVV